MKQKNKILTIKKDIVKRKRFIKLEIKKMILKSILTNQNCKPIIRAKARLYLDNFSKKTSISTQNNNICLKTGRIGGVYNTFNLSRQAIKKIGINNDLQNHRILGW